MVKNICKQFIGSLGFWSLVVVFLRHRGSDPGNPGDESRPGRGSWSGSRAWFHWILWPGDLRRQWQPLCRICDFNCCQWAGRSKWWHNALNSFRKTHVRMCKYIMVVFLIPSIFISGWWWRFFHESAWTEETRVSCAGCNSQFHSSVRWAGN